MGRFSALLAIGLGFLAADASAQQACTTGLCLQQVSCPANGTTSITGKVYAPNGVDPLPNVTVYIPTAPVDAFTPGVACETIGAAPSGSPLIGTISSVDGSFTLTNVPAGSNIPLVIVSGRWRRQFTIPSVVGCTSLTFDTRMPQNQTEGDIPRIAIATGAQDQVECVLLKMGLNQSEFTDPTGTGRINLYGALATNGSGVVLDTATPSQAALMGSQTTLNQYDVLMLPCEGSAITKPAQELANLINFANAGGRVYSSHFSYTWMYQNPPFNGVVNWSGSSQNVSPDPGVATVNTSFTGGQTLQTWLQEVGATTTPGQMPISTLRKDFNGVVAPTQSWLSLNNTTYGNPVMQFVFDTPVNATVNQCGRVLFNEYHVENPTNGTTGKTFPSECSVSTPMTPQEKLLEYSLFELTSEGGQPSLAPTSADFGSYAVGFTTAAQTFTWTNNSSFASQVTSATVTGDFSIVSNNCSAVAAGTSCQIKVVFTPTDLGSRAGTLSVVSSGTALTSSLMGTGTPGYTLSGTSLSFGNQDIGFAAAQTLTLANIAPQALPVPPFVTTSDYAVSTAACGGTLAAGASCAVKVTFTPGATGARNGTLGVNSTSLLYSGLSATLSGNGVDFALRLTPTSGSVIAGDAVTTTATITPIAGFGATVSLSCGIVSAAAASGCGLAATSVVPTTEVTTSVSITTTSQYTVVGYSGAGGRGYLWVLVVGSGLLVWGKRRSVGWRSVLWMMVVAAGVSSLTGCTGKLPTQNSTYTGPGSYVVTLKATDGFLVRTATYTLTVTSK